MPYLLRFLPSFLVFAMGCQNTADEPAPPQDSPVYQDVTATNLPANALGGLSMDAGIADIDGDGDLDIITCNSNGPSFRELTPYRVYLNDGKGVFTDAPSGFLPEGIAGSGFDAEQADFNGDGQPDLFLASRGTPDQLIVRQ